MSSFFYETDRDSGNKENIGTELIIKKDRAENKLVFYETFNNEKYYYNENTIYEWKILNETKKINMYMCQKAELYYDSQKWIAYFTTEIPINDGPFRFYNLPGLIVSIESENGEYSMNLVEIKTFINQFSVNEIDYKKLDKNKFIKQRKLKDYKADILEKFRNNIMTENGKKLLQQYIDDSINKNVLIDLN